MISFTSQTELTITALDKQLDYMALATQPPVWKLVYNRLVRIFTTDYVYVYLVNSREVVPNRVPIQDGRDWVYEIVKLHVTGEDYEVHFASRRGDWGFELRLLGISSGINLIEQRQYILEAERYPVETSNPFFLDTPCVNTNPLSEEIFRLIEEPEDWPLPNPDLVAAEEPEDWPLPAPVAAPVATAVLEKPISKLGKMKNRYQAVFDLLEYHGLTIPEIDWLNVITEMSTTGWNESKYYSKIYLIPASFPDTFHILAFWCQHEGTTVQGLDITCEKSVHIASSMNVSMTNQIIILKPLMADRRLWVCGTDEQAYVRID